MVQIVGKKPAAATDWYAQPTPLSDEQAESLRRMAKQLATLTPAAQEQAIHYMCAVARLRRYPWSCERCEQLQITTALWARIARLEAAVAATGPADEIWRDILRRQAAELRQIFEL